MKKIFTAALLLISVLCVGQTKASFIMNGGLSAKENDKRESEKSATFALGVSIDNPLVNDLSLRLDFLYRNDNVRSGLEHRFGIAGKSFYGFMYFQTFPEFGVVYIREVPNSTHVGLGLNYKIPVGNDFLEIGVMGKSFKHVTYQFGIITRFQ